MIIKTLCMFISAHSPSGRSELQSWCDSLCFNRRWECFLPTSSKLTFQFSHFLLPPITQVFILTDSRYIHLNGKFDYLPYTLQALDVHGQVISTLKFLVDPSSAPSGEIETTNFPGNLQQPSLTTTYPSFPQSCNNFMWVLLSRGSCLFRYLIYFLYSLLC